MNTARTVWIGALIAIAGCATSPLGRSQFMFVGDAEMDKMGVEAFESLKSKGKISGDPQANAYVSCVANAITSVLDPKEIPGGPGPWEVRVFQDDTANAFALPGRKIGVHTGLLPVTKNQDQLATVLGHEIGHVIARHGAERVSDQYATELAAGGAGMLLGAVSDPSSPTHAGLMAALGVGAQVSVLKFSRVQESEADRLGLDLMARAGFDPRESVPLWQNMAAASQGNRPIEFLSTHPAPETRIQDLQRRIPQDLPTAEQAHARGHNPRCR
ncbi:MAG: M48 family metallopeptidase [Deltaproteobacteria bacterium]|nr:MAG: M48 family metallopeptidase [Deltaproteobacteria bacterium]